MFPTSSTAVPSPTFEDYMREHNLTPDHQNLEGWRKVWQREKEVEENAPQVIPPCPTWCILPAGHDYTSTDGWGESLTFERQHVAFEGKYVDVSATEHNMHGVVRLDELLGYLYGEKSDLTAEQVRAVAAEMTRAANVLEEITGGEQ